MKLLFQSSTAKRKALQAANAFRERVLADGGTIQNEAFVNNYYEFMYRTWGYVPRRTYSALAGVQLNKKAVTNLLTYSEEFDNAAWGLSRTNAFGAGSIANDTIAPDGTFTADYIEQQTGQTTGGGVFRSFIMTAGVTYTLSVHAKNSTQGFIRLGGAVKAGGNAAFCGFSLIDGTIGTPDSGLTPRILDLGGGYYRCSITFTKADATGSNLFIYQSDGVNSALATLGSGIYIWGAQLQIGTEATEYIKTEATTVTGLGGYTPVVTNLLTYSEEFDNAVWGKANVTVSANATTAPNGTITADEIVSTVGSNLHLIAESLTVNSGVQYCQSYYIKPNGINYVQIYTAGTGMAFSNYINFDLINGIVGTSSGLTGSIRLDENGFYRIQAEEIAGATGVGVLGIAFVSSASATYRPNFTGDGIKSIYLWGAQLQTGTQATDYVPSNPTFTSRASIGTYFDSNGVLQTASVDEARIDHVLVDGNWVSKGLLLESAATNLLTHSEQFDNAAWAKNNVTVTENTTTAPDGTSTADLFTATATNGYLLQTPIAAGGTKNFSIYVKQNTETVFRINLRDSVLTNDYSAYIFNYSTEEIIVVNFGAVTGTATVDILDDGWYRIKCNGTGFTNNTRIDIVGVTSGASSYIWGAQLEVGSTATSYIKTAGSTQTRSADISDITQGVGTASYVSKMYDMNPTSQFDAIQTDPDKQPLWDTTSDSIFRVPRYDGVDDFMSIDDLGIANAQNRISLFAVHKDTNRLAGDFHAIISIGRNSDSAGRLSIFNRISSDKLDYQTRIDDSTAISVVLNANSTLNSTTAIFNGESNTVTMISNGSSISGIPSAIITNSTNSSIVAIGARDASNYRFIGIIPEAILDRSVFTIAQINALRSFMKQFYPTLP